METNRVTLEEGRRLLAQDADRRRLRAGKYNANRHEFDGHRFASKKEADYYIRLKTQKQKGEIAGFGMQVSYPIVVKGLHICSYISDFDVYYFNGKKEVVDCKGYTGRRKNSKGVFVKAKNSLAYRIFAMKKKLMRAIYNIDVQEV